MLVIGQGSIGQRHARVARALNAQVRVVTSRLDVDGPSFFSVEEVKGAAPDVVIIANETGKHHATLAEVGARWPEARVLVEKPLFAGAEPPPPTTPRDTFVGYCLRFHPAVHALVDRLQGRRLFSIHATVGQHLSLWRPGTDYRASYSARAGEGGALRDLSHELDLAQLLGGGWRRVAALVQHVSDLETAAEDTASLLLELERCGHVTVRVDAIDRAPRRSLLVHAEGLTAEADLVQSCVRWDGVEEAMPLERDALYTAQLRAMMEGDRRWLCPLHEGQRVLGLIEAAERASTGMRWEMAA